MLITETDFDEIYKPVKNHLDTNASFDGCKFETYGLELEYVFALSQTTQKVWTIVEGDNNSLSYDAGFHYVNRLGFLVTEKPWKSEADYVELENLCEPEE